MSKSESMQSARSLLSFLYTFTGLLEAQLTACRELSREAVDGVMRGITEISAQTADERRKANEVLVHTYSNPDSETQAVLNSAQGSVDRVFESFDAGSLKVEDFSPSSSVSGDAEDALRRSIGLFAKHMEALEMLDEKLQQQLMDMMGVLSRDDVVAQRTDHAIAALTALRALLASMIGDFDAAFTPSEVDRRASELLTATWKAYTTQEEKKLFKISFPASVTRKAS